jgi:hypothetical protein
VRSDNRALPLGRLVLPLYLNLSERRMSRGGFSSGWVELAVGRTNNNGPKSAGFLGKRFFGKERFAHLQSACCCRGGTISRSSVVIRF